MESTLAPNICDFLAKDAELENIRQTLKKQGKVGVYGLSEGQRALIEAALVQNRSMLLICESAKRAKTLWEDMSQLVKNTESVYFPALELIPFEVLGQSGELEQQRLNVLAKLLTQKEPLIVITTIEAFGKVLLPQKIMHKAIRHLEVGARVDLTELKNHLVNIGYQAATLVESPGEFAVRGGILDIFSPNYSRPLRLEFFDDEIDSLRFFEIADQRSVDKVKTAQIFPAKEFFLTEQARVHGAENIRTAYEEQLAALRKKKDPEITRLLQNKTGEILERLANHAENGLEQFNAYFYAESASLLSYMPEDTLVCFDEANRSEDAWMHLVKEREQRLTDLLIKGAALPLQGKFFFDTESLCAQFASFERACFSLLPKDSLFLDSAALLSVECKTIPPFFGKVNLLIDELKNWKRQKYRVIILLTSATKALKLQQMLSEYDLNCPWQGDNLHADFGEIVSCYGNLSQGGQFLRSKLVLITENEIFEQQKKRVNKKLFTADGERINSVDELNIGDYVVHASHGIGHYLGIQKLKVDNVEKDYLIVKYAGDDKLYVPVEQFELLQKYTGGEGAAPKVNKLGGSDWLKTKAKVKASVEEIAQKLLETYAKREAGEGYAFSPDDQWQREFEDAFPYVETEDQLKAINDVKKDMMSPKIMDRLICGDVGYGKTEVAIRAAFKCVNDNKQVAVLVPTTVLAQQHYNTFSERFAPYGVKVELLSRFRTAKEQKDVIERLAKGEVDIVIGTHKLLNKSVHFFDLGLLVIDEEQRFGVTHKEKIKALRSEVDVLTMSATPIPRTLHMSLVGIRDMSVIETPPQDRYPIQTYVVEHSPELLVDAIRRELGRGGQVFYVHNRIEDIESVAIELAELVPEARVLIGHGKMKEHELEDVMMEFINQEADVLLCTTIIETGLDIPNANTLIIDNADRMGLSQLYQLRGRVGRSNRVAYAYLTYKKDKSLNSTAEKRLSAVREYTELGSGIKIAMKDLEIRGAGNLLGSEQHGQVCAVGFDLYCKMLDDAIRELKGEKSTKETQTEVDLQVSAFIPEYYIRDAHLKLTFYQRIQNAATVSALGILFDELVDRFGDVPKETENLLTIAEIRLLAREAGITSLKQKAGVVVMRFAHDTAIEIPALYELAKQYKRRLNYTNAAGELILKLTVGSMDQKDCLDLVKSVVSALASLA